MSKLTTRLLALFVAAAAAPLPLACGGDSAPRGPHVVPGGGIGDGPISGRLAVYVTDDDTEAPVAGAAVRVGGSADPAPCMATSDSTGLVLFEAPSCPSLAGKQTITASAGGYAPSTWIGVNGTNVTMTIRATTRPAVETATVTGTIDGWAGLPAPAQNHQTLGLVSTSQTRDLGAAENEIAQGTRTITVPVIGAVDIPANACVRNALANDCNFRLTTRTGPQAHFAVIIDQDTKGTPLVDTDDTFTVIGWAVKTGLDFAAGATASGESIPLLADADMQSLSVSMSGPPAGLDALGAITLIDLGASGRIAMALPVPAAAQTQTTMRVPKLTGALASARYDVIAQARDAADKALPSTMAWLRGVDIAATVSVPSWLPPPSGLTATGGTYSFSPVTGAALHGAELQTAAGARAWSISIFDGSTSFTLPGLTPDPLPSGMARFEVSALQIPGVDLANVDFDAAVEKLTAISSDQIIFTR